MTSISMLMFRKEQRKSNCTSQYSLDLKKGNYDHQVSYEFISFTGCLLYFKSFETLHTTFRWKRQRKKFSADPADPAKSSVPYFLREKRITFASEE